MKLRCLKIRNKFIFVLLSMLISQLLHAEITITTAAGRADFGGDGGVATSALLSQPKSVAIDALGNVYIADSYNNRIRKVDTKGVITTVAGNGDQDYKGDNGQATNASLDTPQGIAVDTAGNLYIADTYNKCIRKVDTNGVITTVAGKGIDNIYLDYPNSVTVDVDGNLYISDTENDRILKLDSNGITTTVAGNYSSGFSGDGDAAVSAQLNSPSQVAIDSTGNLYIADTGNRRIRKVDTNGIITTFAGVGLFGDESEGIPATSAELSNPVGVAIDSEGSLYISDSKKNRIRKVDTNGNITTIAGNGEQGGGGDGKQATDAKLNWPTGIAIDTFGNIYFADRNSDRIRKVGTDGKIATVVGGTNYEGDGWPATSVKISKPTSIVTDSEGSLFIIANSNSRIDIGFTYIQKLDSNGILSLYSDVFDSGNSSIIAFDAKGDFYYSTGNQIYKRDKEGIITLVAGNSSNGGYSGDGGLAIDAELDEISDIAIDSLGNLYILDSGNRRIRKVDTSGIITTIAGKEYTGVITGDIVSEGDGGPAVNAYLYKPFRITVDSAGNLYVACENVIRKIDTNGIISTVVEGIGRNPSALAIDASDILYFTYDKSISNSSSLARLDSRGFFTTIMAVNGAKGLAFDEDGNLFIADTENNQILRVTGLSDSAASINSTLPTAPIITKIDAGDGQVTVSFTPPVSNGGSQITSYIVRPTLGGQEGVGSESPITVTGLFNDAPYYFTVVAVNSFGEGQASTFSYTVTPSAEAGNQSSPNSSPTDNSNTTSDNSNATSESSSGGGGVFTLWLLLPLFTLMLLRPIRKYQVGCGEFTNRTELN